MFATIPPETSQRLAHIRAYLRRGELLPALEDFSTLLNLYKPAQFANKPRFEIEDSIKNSLIELQKHAPVKDFLKEITNSDKTVLSYRIGSEITLSKQLNIIYRGLLAKQEAAEKEAEQQLIDRYNKLWARGRELINNGELVKGKAMLRKLADEFPDDLDLAVEVADYFKEHRLYVEAGELYKRTIEQSPKNSKAYAGLVVCFIELNEYEQAEGLYNQHLRQFGRHPRTIVNLAWLYLRWGKRSKALDTAYQALAIDPENVEAKAIIDENER